tara:strand:- start:565 stop:711 length:147 start_codon:yes stop_codon:yes gene_type:complete
MRVFFRDGRRAFARRVVWGLFDFRAEIETIEYSVDPSFARAIRSSCGE